MKMLYNIFGLWIWQFPQTLVGAILVVLLQAEKRTHTNKNGVEIVWYLYDKDKNWFTKFISGVSLSCFILLCERGGTPVTIEHEYGHSIQSQYLGWFYLPIVGIYSAIFCNMWQRWTQDDWNWYDKHYWYYITRWTESWADNLGGVNRNDVLRTIPRPADSRFPAQENQRAA